MSKEFYYLAVLCIIALPSNLSLASSFDHRTKSFQLSDNDSNGYWLSYNLSSACFKCNCSLTAKLEFYEYAEGSDMIIVHINESTCNGVPKEPGLDYCPNSCIGRSGFLVGQLINRRYQFNGTMGESTCAGSNPTNHDLFPINCQGQQRSESLMFTIKLY